MNRRYPLVLVFLASCSSAATTGDSTTLDGGLDSAMPQDGSVGADSSSDAPSNQGDGGNRIDAAPSPSPGCGRAVALTGQQNGTITAAGQSRSFIYVVPAGYSPNDAIPLTFGFHGRGGAGSQALGWGMQTAAMQNGQKGIFVYPDGVMQPGGATGWAMEVGGEDVLLFDALVDWAEKNFCIDTHRVFAAGFSWGNDFANALGCFRGDKIRAVNGFSGSFYSSGCTSVVPAYRATYSTPNGTDAYSQTEIDNAINHYRQAHGCNTMTQPIAPSPCLAYQGCAKPVISCPYPNMGHTVPPNGGAAAWAFFATFP